MNNFKLKNNKKFPKLGNYIIPDFIDTKVAVDLGANNCLFTVKYHKKFDTIYFFEASYMNFISGLANVLSKGIKNSTGFNLAASNISGEIVKIHSHNNGDCGSNSILQYKDINVDDYHSVLSISFENIFDLINEEKINYLKIDIEGAEYQLLKHADLSNVDAIGIEIHNNLGLKKMEEVRQKLSQTHELYAVKHAIPDVCNEEATYILKDLLQ